ncbi:MAG: TolC family outer membrane protein [Gammaproteobacteria bacterium]|nr:TolC family outer membrane protein [Gammaproteobacteria bacterium]
MRIGREYFLALGLAAGLTASVQAADIPDLLAIYQDAEGTDPAYLQAQANAAAVAEGVPQARAQLFLPSLRLSGQIAYNRSDTKTASFGIPGISTYESKQLSLSATQPVFHYDRIIALRQADQRLQQAQYQTIAAQQELMVRVAERYFTVLGAEDSLAFAQAELEALQRQLEQAQQRFEVGLIAITDVQESRAGYDRAVANEILARNALENAREGLREVTLAYHTEIARLGTNPPLSSPDPENIEVWVNTALEQNLALSSARIAADLAHQDIRAQYANHLPTLDISGSHSFSSSGGRFGDSEQESSGIGLNLSLSLYEGGQIVSRTRQAEHRHSEAIERLEQQQRTVYRQARQSYLEVLSTISAVKAYTQAVVSAETALESTQAGFEVGTRTAGDVVTSQRNLFQSRRDYSRARYDYILSIFKLKQAAGTLAADDLALANSWLVRDQAAANTGDVSAP